MNNVFLIGNLTRDARIFTIKDNRVLAIVTVAVNYKKRNGEDGVDYIPVKFVTKENVAKYLLKGKKVAITGRLQSYVKDNRTQIIVNATNVEFLSRQPRVTAEEANGETIDIPPEILNEPF